MNQEEIQKKQIGTYIEPTKPNNVPNEAQWLAGTGTGAWFYLEPTHEPDKYRICRFSPKGILECDRILQHEGAELFVASQDYQFTYLSHCQKCTVLQNGIRHLFVFQIKWEY